MIFNGRVIIYAIARRRWNRHDECWSAVPVRPESGFCTVEKAFSSHAGEMESKLLKIEREKMSDKELWCS